MSVSARFYVSLNGGANQSGGVDAASLDTVSLVPASTVGWLRARWEIYDYPEGWAAPAGWSTAASGTIFYDGITPPDFDLPDNAVLWGVWMLRCLINEQIDTSEQELDGLIDDDNAICVLSPFGLRDLGARELAHFTTSTTRIKGWLRSYQRNLRTIEGAGLGGGLGSTSEVGASVVYGKHGQGVGAANADARKKATPVGHFDPADYGARSDWKKYGITGTATNGSATIASVSSDPRTVFVVGQRIGIESVPSSYEIASMTATTITLTGPVSASSVGGWLASDDYDAWAAMLTEMLADQNASRKIIVKGWSYLRQDIVLTQTVHIEGMGRTRATVETAGVGSRSSPGTWLVFPKNVTGIRVKSDDTGEAEGQTQSAEHTTIRNLVLHCDDPTTTSGHGINASVEFEAENVGVENFGGNGFHLYAYVGDSTGNVDLSVLKGCYAKNNANGFHIEGSEANAIRVVACNAFGNRAVGFYDESGSGNTAYAFCHASANGTYNYQTVGTPNTSSFFHCYNEGSENCSFASGTNIFGGNLAGSTTTDSGAFELSGGTASRAPFEYRNMRGARNVRIRMGEPTTGTGMQVLSLEVLGTGTSTSLQDISTCTYGGDSDPWWIYTNDNQAGYREFMRLPTSMPNADPRVPAPWFANGVYLGPVVGTANMGGLTQMRLWASTESAIPSRQRSGMPISYEVGDMGIDAAVSTGSRLGRRCTSAGTLSAGVLPASMPTATTTSGSATITVSSGSGLAKGQYIAIVGVTGTKQIFSVVGTTVVLTTTCSASVAGAAVTFVDPVFEELFASTRPAVAMAALNVDWSAGEVFGKTLAAGANAITFSNVTDGQTISVRLTSNGGGSTASWPAGVKWPGGVAPTLTTPSGTDIFTFMRENGVTYGIPSQAFA